MFQYVTDAEIITGYRTGYSVLILKIKITRKRKRRDDLNVKNAFKR